MFDNETYSFLYYLHLRIQPIFTIWYLYLYFWKLYPRIAKASLMATQAKATGVHRTPSHEEVGAYMVISQLAVSWLMRNKNRKP